ARRHRRDPRRHRRARAAQAQPEARHGDHVRRHRPRRGRHLRAHLRAAMTIKTASLNGVATIEIARPEKKNAITQAMYRQMAEALDAAASDGAVRAVLLTGQPGIFTSGNDIDDFMRRPPGGDASPALVFMKALIGCDKPVVAAVTGAAIGIGTTMLLH